MLGALEKARKSGLAGFDRPQVEKGADIPVSSPKAVTSIAASSSASQARTAGMPFRRLFVGVRHGQHRLFSKWGRADL
jgi:hypothetical protein